MPRILALLLASIVLATACEVRGGATFEIGDHDTRIEDVSVEAHFVAYGDAAVVLGRPEHAERLAGVFSDQTGVPSAEIDRQTSSGRLELRAASTVEAITAGSDVTGIESVSFEGERDRGRLGVTLVEPARFVAALSDAVAEEPDAAALRSALRGSAYVGVTVGFAGGIETWDFQAAAEGPDAAGAPELVNGRVEWYQPLSRFTPGTLVVDGSTEPASSRGWLWAGGAIIVVGALYLAARHDQRRRALEALGR